MSKILTDGLGLPTKLAPSVEQEKAMKAAENFKQQVQADQIKNLLSQKNIEIEFTSGAKQEFNKIDTVHIDSKFLVLFTRGSGVSLRFNIDQIHSIREEIVEK